MAVLWTAFIIYALTKEPSGLPRYKWFAIQGVDKLIHFLIFFIEAVFIALAKPIKPSFYGALATILFCSVLGGALELVQYYYVDGRSGDTIDWLADTLGAVVGVLILWVIREKNTISVE